MSTPRRVPRLSVVGALLLAIAGSALTVVSASAQGDAGDFPVPVLAPVLPVTGAPPPLAVTSFAVTDGDGSDTVIEVRFAGPFEVPDAFRYRVDLRLGQPGSTGPTQTRVSFLVVDGAEPEGLVEVGNGSGWDRSDAVDADLDGAVLSLGLPESVVAAAGDVVWLDASLIEEEGDAAQRFLSPLFPADQVLAPAGATITAAELAWGSIDQQPPAPAIDLGPAPLLSLDGDELVVEYQESVPAFVGDRTVVKLVDVVRIVPGFDGQGAPPYLVAIDHELQSVSLLDGTANSVWPPSISTDGEWLLTGFPDRSLGTRDQIRVSLPAVLAAFGVDGPGDLATDDQLAVGLARSAQLQAQVGEPYPVRSDGVLATTRWLSTTEVVPEAPTTVGPDGSVVSVSDPSGDDVTAGVAGEQADDDADGGSLVLVALGCLIALLGIAAYLGVRWLEHRRQVMANGPVVPIGPPPEPTDAEREELAEFTRQLFDNRR